MSTALPVSQSYALLYLRRCGADSLYNKLTDAMRAMGVSFVASDWEQLRALNYVRRDGGGRHSLTPNGLWKAQTLARELARQYQIHHVTFREPGKGSTLGPSIVCTCGWGTIASKRNENSTHRYAQEHLAQVACGAWKPPRSIDEIFADHFGTGTKSDSGEPATIVACPPVAFAGGPDPGTIAGRGVIAAAVPGMEATDA